MKRADTTLAFHYFLCRIREFFLDFGDAAMIVHLFRTAGVCGSLNRKLASMSKGCEVCESHTETCGICNGIFCPSCLSFNQCSTPKLHQQTTGKFGNEKELKSD